MLLSCCIENCSNNSKSQPNLNFYILPSDKQQRRRWLQAVGRAEIDTNRKVLNKTWSPKTRYHFVCSENGKTFDLSSPVSVRERGNFCFETANLRAERNALKEEAEMLI